MVTVRGQVHDSRLGLELLVWAVCTERISKLLGLGSSSDVSASVKLRFHVEEIPGCLSW